MSIERFLKQRAVDIVMEGTYMLSNWYDPQGKLRTFTCRANARRAECKDQRHRKRLEFGGELALALRTYARPTDFG